MANKGIGFRLLGISSFLMLVGSGLAQDLKPEHIAQAVQRTIQLGGDLKQWEGLPQYPVVLSNSKPAVEVKAKGYFSLAWDNNRLYVLGVFEQPKDTVLARMPAEAPDWWNDDAMELFIHTDPKDKEIDTDINSKTRENLQFAVNPAGTRFKTYTATTEYQTAGRVEADRWIMEFSIPLGTALLPKVTEGMIWRLKVGREHQKATEYPIWPMGGGFHDNTTYGYLVFNKTLQDPQATLQKVRALF